MLVKEHHQKQAFEILESLRSEIFKEFCNNLKLEVTKEVKLEIAKKQIFQGRFNDAALLIIKEKFHDQFDVRDLMLKLAQENRLDTAKHLI